MRAEIYRVKFFLDFRNKKSDPTILFNTSAKESASEESDVKR